MKSFVKLCLHDTIISSIYNAQDNDNIVWKGRWSAKVCNCHCMNEFLVVNALKASLKTQASQGNYMAVSAMGSTQSTSNDGLHINTIYVESCSYTV